MHDMPRPPLLYAKPEKNRHGNWIWYFRPSKKVPRVRLKGAPYSKEFMAHYRQLMAGQEKLEQKAARGDLRWLSDRWRESTNWTKTAKSTQRQRDNILHHVLKKNGTLPYTLLVTTDIEDGIAKRVKLGKPFAANNYLKTMKALFKWAKKSKFVDTNPANEIEFIKLKTEGWEPWTEDDIAAYRARWKLGTRQRLAMELVYWTGFRRGDLVRFGRQHIGKNGVARMSTEKGQGKVVASVFMPKQIAEIIAASPTGDLQFLITAKGTAFDKATFGNEFREWCDKAKVTKSAHGLRKRAAAEAAEGGGSEEALMAHFGWQTIGQSLTYTRSAKKDRLAIETARTRTFIPAPENAIPALEKSSGFINRLEATSGRMVGDVVVTPTPNINILSEGNSPAPSVEKLEENEALPAPKQEAR